MNPIFCSYVLLIVLTLGFADDKIITTGVYYEALCPDSRNFVVNQLADDYVTDRLVDKINLELIPFGKGVLNETSNDYVCQFDANWDSSTPCRANTLHLCIINLYFDGQSDENKLRAVNLINCSFTPSYWRSNYSVAIEECHQQLYNTSAEPVFNCYDSRKRELLDAAAQKTSLLNPALDYVPWITFWYRQKDFELHFKNSVNTVLNGPTCETSATPTLEPSTAPTLQPSTAPTLQPSTAPTTCDSSAANLIHKFYFVSVFAIFITIIQNVIMNKV